MRRHATKSPICIKKNADDSPAKKIPHFIDEETEAQRSDVHRLNIRLFPHELPQS